MEAMTLGLSGYIGLLLLMGSLVPGALITAFAAETIFGLGRGKFWDKFGRQFAAMGVKALFCLLLLVIPALFWLFPTPEDSLRFVLDPSWLIPRTALLPLLLGWLGLAVYSGSWVQLRRSRALHRVLGGMSLLGVLGGAYCGLNLLLSWMVQGGIPTSGAVWEAIWFPATGAVWPALAAVTGNGVGGAGIAGMGYLILRRNKDDFGRDYYRFAMPQAARWGLVLLAPVAIAAGWLGLRGLTWTPVLASSLALVGVAALVGVWLNVRVIRSSHPLRLKGGALAACLLAWILDSALVYSLLLTAGGIPAGAVSIPF
ncbi:MAG: hypothetical protein K9J48_01095 [Desulfohalobiaceae bacterium]|nr:hypothetical protein [Desulfohalobiaceae bacterium]